MQIKKYPEILAPAGDPQCFLAALAAGANAIYVGLKHFSARMQAENFSTSELSRLVDLAHEQDARVYVAMNTLLKPEDMQSAYNLISRINKQVKADALIVQDLGFLNLARQAGFTGELHLSTLANITHPAGLISAHKLGASRVIIPRELSIDEIRLMGEACPSGLELETFVHGALCYCVSGRCYWSSYMGGKSGLRGRCVQPCRRMYKQGGSNLARMFNKSDEEAKRQLTKGKKQDKNNDYAKYKMQNSRTMPNARPTRVGKEHSGRYFSCLDLSLDALTKTLLDIPNLSSWKIEGRKKGPHYVYHVVSAYKLLRDNSGDSQAKKMAMDFLEMSLGRPTSKARFLPQKNNIPTDPNTSTSSGLLIGKVAIDEKGLALVKPYQELLPQDYLRIGVEDQSFHSTLSVTRRIPKAGTLSLRVPKHKTPKAGTSVFLIDRREPELIQTLKLWQSKLDKIKGRPSQAISGEPHFSIQWSKENIRGKKLPDLSLRSNLPQGRETRSAKGGHLALWLSPKASELSRTIVSRISWWLPPVIWPEEEKSIKKLVVQMYRNGARQFVCNAPWQIELFENKQDLELIAGPFCNIANIAHLSELHNMGYSMAIVSPELPESDLLKLPQNSPMPLGFMLEGFWPVGIARFGLLGIKANEPFVSPKGEIFWARNYGANVWIYPAWPLDFTEKRSILENAGYNFFVRIIEHAPQNLPELSRDGLFNWNGELL